MKPSEQFERWLMQNPSPWFIGEVVILPGYELRHMAESRASSEELQVLIDFTVLREWIKYQEDGEFRAVRGFRGLRKGWRMKIEGLSNLLLALNWIYPAGVALWAEHQAGLLKGTEFNETTERQTGMYRITQVITEEQLARVIGENCEASCLRQRFWWKKSEIESQESRIPLLCPEACNYLVAKARGVIKEE